MDLSWILCNNNSNNNNAQTRIRDRERDTKFFGISKYKQIS